MSEKQRAELDKRTAKAVRVRSQFARDVILLSSIFIASLIYWYGLKEYLHDLKNPLPMIFVLCTSLAVSALYDLKGVICRENLISFLITAIIFAASPWLAIEYREWYLDVITQLKGAPEVVDAIGHEYIRAVENPAVGIGSCFAMAIATIRIPLHRVITTCLIKAFVVNKAAVFCPHCGQATRHS